ncbi:MAG: peptidase inhibitor family I36 protein [Acidimicrobiia bacterium]
MRRLLPSLVALALVLLVPMVAQADANCDSGEFCIWGNENQGGDFWDPSTDDLDWPCCGAQGVQNDDDSVRNRESVRVLVYQGNNHTGAVSYCTVSGEIVNVIFSDRDNAGNSNDTHTTSNSCSGFPPAD